MQHKPFGDKELWNDEDIAIITETTLSDLIVNYTLIDLDLSTTQENVCEDRSGNGLVGVFINDYGLLFDDETLIPSAKSSINSVKSSGVDKGKPF